jgi:hypothetical protein
MFPPGSIRAAVAAMGDDWTVDMPSTVQNSVEALAEVDHAATTSSAWRRSVLRRDVGYQVDLPVHLRRGL